MRKKLIIFFLFIANTYAFAYPFLPTVKSFTKSEYMAGRQNWAIDYDSFGTMYFGNNQGLLHYSYESWELYKTTTSDNVRSIHVNNDTIWVGGNRELGYFYTGSNNKLEYKNVADVNRGQVWRLEFLNNKLYGQTEAGIYIYDNSLDSTSFIGENNGFFNICEYNNEIWALDRQLNLGKIVDNKFQILKQIEKEEQLIDMFVHRNKLMLAFNDGEIISVSRNLKLEKYYLPKEIVDLALFKVGSYEDNVLMIATITDGIVLYDIVENYIVTKINADNGLSDDTVLCLKKDNQGNLWAGLDYGIGFVENQRLLKPVFKGAATYDFKIYGDTTFLASNKGLFRSINKNSFQLLDKLHGQIWRLKEYNNDMLICHNNGLFVLNGSLHSIYDDTGVLDIVNFKGTNKFIVSAYTGLLLMELIDGQLIELENLYYWGNPKIEYDEDGNSIWAKSKDGELKRYSLLEGDANIDTQVFEKQSNFFKINNKILFYNDEFLSEYTNDEFLKVDYYPFSVLKGPKITHISSNAKEDKLVYIQDNKIEYLLNLTDGNFYSFGNALSSLESRMLEGSEMLTFHNEELWIGTDRGVEKFEPNSNVKYQQNLDPFVSKIIVKEGDITETFYYPYLANNLKLPKGPIDLNIQFGVQKTSRDFIEFRYKLEPYDDNWSTWTTDKQKGYSKLGGGEYKMLIESRINKGSIHSNEIKIFIEQRWFETILLAFAILILLVLLSIVLFAIYRYLSNKKIERLREEQQIELYEKTIKSRNDKLLGYTEVLSQKNKFLRSLKDDLLVVKHKIAERSVRKIDMELNNQNKDLIFHDLFSELHQDFISRLHEEFNELTSHDIRFLSLIRLNQSNDQIANMMNISPKSVNVTRYRIRKKMNLEHETDLNKFILEF